MQRPIAANNGSKTYSFTALPAGSYVYSDTLNTNINREMGLYGAFIVASCRQQQTSA